MVRNLTIATFWPEICSGVCKASSLKQYIVKTDFILNKLMRSKNEMIIFKKKQTLNDIASH